MLDSLNRGGAETMMLDVCRNARAGGIDLTFVATGGGDLEDDFRHSGVEFIQLKRKLPVDLPVASRLRQIIKERNIQVVHSHQPVEALHQCVATRGLATKRVMTLHGVYPGTKNQLALKLVLPQMHAKIVVSQTLRNELNLCETRDCWIVRNGVDPARLQSAGRKLRTELNVAEDELLLGMVGNFQPVAQKDQLSVCRALPALLKTIPQARFVFAGGGSTSAPRLLGDCVDFCREAHIEDRVHFLGKRSDIPDVLHSLDVFVLSTLREGSPISVIEAMLAGVPVVLSDIPALREVTNAGQHAVLFPPGDAEDLAAKLSALLLDEPGRQNLSTNARHWAMEEFGIERHIAELRKLYGSLI